MEARNLCDKVVEEDDKCIKGYFRRGEALVALNEHALAMTDFEKVLELDADNKAAKNKVAMCVRQIKANKQKEKKTFANMFDKVSVCTFIYTYLLPTYVILMEMPLLHIALSRSEKTYLCSLYFNRRCQREDFLAFNFANLTF